MNPRSNASTRVLVTGATGTTGRAITASLAELGFAVRAASPHAPPPSQLSQRDQLNQPNQLSEHVVFDWRDPSNHDEVLRGVDRVYLLAPGLAEGPEARLLPFLERALALGLRRVVLLSSSAVAEGEPGLGAIHRFVRERAPEWAVLRPSWFMQNFVDRRHHLGAGIAREGAFVSCTGEGRVPFIDAADIAAVATRALADETPRNTDHVITGPEALSYDDVAAVISTIVGRPVRHVHAAPDEAIRIMTASGIPPAYAAMLAELEGRIRRGEEARVTDVVFRLTGRAPRSFADFARANAASWRA